MKTHRTLDYCILHDAEAAGPAIGTFGGRGFPQYVRDMHGRLFQYVGLASRRLTGQLDPDALGSGEYIVLPGLVYRLVTRHHGWMR